jgi:hypothetical protein
MQGGTLMHHDASPPETLPLSILQARARGKEQLGNEIANCATARIPFYKPDGSIGDLPAISEDKRERSAAGWEVIT